MTISTNKARKILRTRFGARRYRITSEREIHVYGRMPNTNVTGWYFFGFLGEKMTEERIKEL